MTIEARPPKPTTIEVASREPVDIYYRGYLALITHTRLDTVRDLLDCAQLTEAQWSERGNGWVLQRNDGALIEALAHVWGCRVNAIELPEDSSE